jgi:putative tricarboxylic transport membrane protein
MKNEEDAGRAIVSKRSADIVVALILLGIGVVLMVDSWRSGAGWADNTPQTGYFPFYIGLLIVLSSLGTLGVTLFRHPERAAEPFVERAQFISVLKVLIPAAVFVAAIGFLGIYLAMALFIGAFMRWLGRFRWHTVVLVSVAVPIVLFAVFEIWFLVSLPKGPIETYLGY